MDKPAGITSFGVVAKVRKALRVSRVGHAGTLDPMATGLLIIGIGKGTKCLGEYLKLPKVYEATIRVGVRTDTSDIEGKIVEQRDVLRMDIHTAKSVIEGLRGELTLPVSAYSAIKQGGVPLYKKARRGESVVVPLRTMHILEAAYLGIESAGGVCDIRARFAVGSGTYIRSLAEEVGKRLGMPATLARLRRTEVGPFTVKDAVTIEDLEKRSGGR